MYSTVSLVADSLDSDSQCHLIHPIRLRPHLMMRHRTPRLLCGPLQFQGARRVLRVVQTSHQSVFCGASTCIPTPICSSSSHCIPTSAQPGKIVYSHTMKALMIYGMRFAFHFS